MNKKTSKKFISLVVAFVFTLTQLALPSSGWSAPPGEVRVPSTGLQLTLPPELGTIQSIHSGNGPTLIHIQTAHGNYEAQKKIQALLHYLKDTYGFKLLLLEGSASKLKPELLRFFPQRMDLTMKIAEELTKEALVKGDELFLLEEPKAEAYGIEDIETYRKTREAFKAVILQKEKTEQFLQEMDLQIERLTGPYLNKNLRSFLRRLEAFESKTLPFLDWLSELNTQAKRALDLDLTDPLNQLDWPMLLRIFKLKEFESKIDLDAFSKERKEFLKAIRRIPRETHVEIETLLSSPLSRNQLPDPETGLLFERMVEALPENFNYDAFPNAKLFIGHLIFQSELKGDRLMEEMDRLTDQVSENLAKTEEEKKILSLLKDYRLLVRLFALELMPEDYEKILKTTPSLISSPPEGGRGGEVRGELLPSRVIQRFLELNNANRVHNFSFSHLNEIDSLFEKALEFYQGVKERDVWMLENIEARLKETEAHKAVVITGGFHAGPFKNFFEVEGYNYALIVPKMTSTSGREAYLQAALQNSSLSLAKSTMELPRRSELRQVQIQLGENLPYIQEVQRAVIRRILKQAKEPIQEGPPNVPIARAEARTVQPLAVGILRDKRSIAQGIAWKKKLDEKGQSNEYIFGGGHGYDIRINNSLKDWTEATKFFYAMGRTFGGPNYLKHTGKALVTGDQRFTSDAFRLALVQGLADEGIEVFTPPKGEVITTGLASRKALAGDDYQLVVQVTGSHNPPEGNGAKITYRGELFSRKQLPQLSRAIEDKASWSNRPLPKARGRIRVLRNLIPEHIEALDRVLPRLKNPPFLIADFKQGAGGSVFIGLAEKKGYQIVRLDSPEEELPEEVFDPAGKPVLIVLNEKPSAGMGAGIWDPSKPEAFDGIRKVQQRIEMDPRVSQLKGRRYGGVVLDGDGDRAGFVTERGELLLPERMMMAFYQRMVLDNLEGIRVLNRLGHTLKLALIVTASKVSAEVLYEIADKEGLKIADKKGIEVQFISAGAANQRGFVKEELTKIERILNEHPELTSGERDSVEELMREYVAAETSGHFYFNILDPKEFLKKKIVVDDGVVSTFLFLDLLRFWKKTMEEVDALFPRLPITHEIRMTDAPQDVKKKQEFAEKAILEFAERNQNLIPMTVAELGNQIKAARQPPQRQPTDEELILRQLTAEKLILVDGIRLVLKNGVWILLRKSNTSAVIVFKAEAESPEKLPDLVKTAELLGEAMVAVKGQDSAFANLDLKEFEAEVNRLRSLLRTKVTAPNEFAKATAQEVAEEIRRLQKDPSRSVNIVFATGNTMKGFLDELSKETNIDWTRIQAFHLDEYLGLATAHEASFAYFLKAYLFDKVPSLPEENIHYVNGAQYNKDAPDANQAHMKKYMEKLHSLGGADIVILGMGMDGHLAFNEPPKFSNFYSRMQVVELDESTLKANEPDYLAIRENPYALTMGMADIMEGRHLFFFANGKKKSDIVKQSLEGPVTEKVPASILQLHPNVTIVLDTDAAKLLKTQPPRAEVRTTLADIAQILEQVQEEYGQVEGIGSQKRNQGYEQALKRMGGEAILLQILNDPLVANDQEAIKQLIRLAAFGKGETLQRFTVLSDKGKQNYLHDLKTFVAPHLPAVERIYQKYFVRGEKPYGLNVTPETVTAPPVLAINRNAPKHIPGSLSHQDRAQYERIADEKILGLGKVGIFQVAGGSGARLGFSDPKGMLLLGPIKKLSLFERVARRISAMSHRYGKQVPWAIMTSDSDDNHERTMKFFGDHIDSNRFFGLLDLESVLFAKQRILPTFQFNGEFVVRPDPAKEGTAAYQEGEFEVGGFGNGDSNDYILQDHVVLEVTRFMKDGDQPRGYRRVTEPFNVYQWFRSKGVEFLQFIPVDNALAIAPRAAFGIHFENFSDIANEYNGQFPQSLEHASPIAVSKYPSEKTGMVTRVEGKDVVFEYNQIPDELSHLPYVYMLKEGGQEHLVLLTKENDQIVAVDLQEWQEKLNQLGGSQREQYKQNLVELEKQPDRVTHILFSGASVPREAFALWLGNANIGAHIWTLSTLPRQEKLPVRLDKGKQSSAVDQSGNVIKAPRIKAELMVFDAPKRGQVLRTGRPEIWSGFAPVKNASGNPVDTLETAEAVISESYQLYLREAGWTVDDSATVELDPSVTGYDDFESLRDRIGQGSLAANSKLYLVGGKLEIGSLHLAKGAQLAVSQTIPGEVYDTEISIGDNVTVSEGIKVDIQMQGNGRLEIESGTTIARDLKLDIGSNEILTVRSNGSVTSRRRAEVRAGDPPGRIGLLVTSDKRAMAEEVARRLVDVVRKKPNAVLGLAPGSTMEEVYQEVVKIFVEDPKSNFSPVVTFNPDEYVGIDPQHEASYRSFMEKHLFGPLRRIDPARAFQAQNMHFFNSHASHLELEAETEQFVGKIRATEKGRMDWIVLGIGQNGHFAFQEPAVVVGRTIDQEIEIKIRDFNEFILDPGLSEEELSPVISRILAIQSRARSRLGDFSDLVERLREARIKYFSEKNLPRDPATLTDQALQTSLNALGERLLKEQKISFYLSHLTPTLIERLRESDGLKGISFDRIEFKKESDYSGVSAKIVYPAIPTLLDNSRFFLSLDSVPAKAFTLVSAIREADEIVLAASGAEKSDAIRGALVQKATPELPASTLQDHPNTIFVVDQEAASKLPPGDPIRRQTESQLRLRTTGVKDLSSEAAEEKDETARLVYLLHHPESFPFDRFYAAQELGKLGESATSFVIGALADALNDRDPKVRMESARSLGRLGEKALPAVEPLIEKLKDRILRREVILSFSQIGKRAIPLLVQALESKDWRIRSGVAHALGRMKVEALDAREALRTLARRDPKRSVQIAASDALRRIGEEAPPDIRRERLPSQEAIVRYRAAWNKAKEMKLLIGLDVQDTGVLLAVEILKGILEWQAKLPPDQDVIIHFSTGDTPWLGYAKLAEFLKNWNDPATQALLAKYRIDAARERPDMKRVKALPLDTLFPQRRTDYHAFPKILNDMFDQIGIPREKRFFFYGDIDPDDPELKRPMSEEKFAELMREVEKNGLLVNEFLDGRLDEKQNPIQYRYFQTVQESVRRMTRMIEDWGGAHILIAGVGHSYRGEGHVAFMESGKRFEQEAFFGSTGYHTAAGHSKENGGMNRLYTAQKQPKFGFITFGWYELLMRRAQDPSDRVKVIVMATGNPKSSSVQKAIEGHYDVQFPVSGFQKSRGVFIVDRTAAAGLRLFTNPWEFEPVGDDEEILRRFFIRLGKDRKEKIKNLTPQSVEVDLLRHQNQHPPIYRTTRLNLTRIVSKGWGTIRNRTAEGIEKGLVLPEETSEKLNLPESSSIVLINPHLDDDFLAYRDLIKAWTAKGHKVSSYYLTKGYTAVHDSYVEAVLGEIQKWSPDQIRELSEVVQLQATELEALNQEVKVETKREKQQGLLQEKVLGPLRQRVYAEQKKILKRLVEVLKDQDLHRAPDEYDVWNHMSGEERELRAKLVFLHLNLHLLERLLRSALGAKEDIPAERLDQARLDQKQKVDALANLVQEVLKKKPSWGSSDFELIQDIKTDLRFTEAQTALMSVGVEHSHIYYPFSSTWYAAGVVRGTAEASDIELLKGVFRKDRPNLIVVNGEGFPDYGAHSTTEASTIEAVRELNEEGEDIVKQLRILQYAGVWERIPVEDAQVMTLIPGDRMREFDREFRNHYPSQAPPPVPDPGLPSSLHFSRQVMENARESLLEIGTLINVPRSYRERSMDPDSGILNYKILDVSDPNVLEAFHRRNLEMQRVKKVLDAVKGTAIHGPVPQTDLSKVEDSVLRTVESSGLAWEAFFGDQEFSQILQLGIWALKESHPGLSRMFEQYLKRTPGKRSEVRQVRERLIQYFQDKRGQAYTEDLIRQSLAAENFGLPSAESALSPSDYQSGIALTGDMQPWITKIESVAIEEITRLSTEDSQTKKRAEAFAKEFLKQPQLVNPLSMFQLEEILYQIIEKETGNPDPYRDIRKRLTEESLKKLDEIEAFAASSEDPLRAAFLVSAAANEIDFANPANPYPGKFNFEQMIEQLRRGQISFGRDDYDLVRSRLQNSSPLRLLILADNAGEFEASLPLYKRLLQMGHHLTISGKAGPATNDKTAQEIRRLLRRKPVKDFLKGKRGKDLTQQIRVVHDGSRYTGVNLARVPKEFVKAWQSADLVLMSGHGHEQQFRFVRSGFTRDLVYLNLTKEYRTLGALYRPGGFVIEFQPHGPVSSNLFEKVGIESPLIGNFLFEAFGLSVSEVAEVLRKPGSRPEEASIELKTHDGKSVSFQLWSGVSERHGRQAERNFLAGLGPVARFLPVRENQPGFLIWKPDPRFRVEELTRPLFPEAIEIGNGMALEALRRIRAEETNPLIITSGRSLEALTRICPECSQVLKGLPILKVPAVYRKHLEPLLAKAREHHPGVIVSIGRGASDEWAKWLGKELDLDVFSIPTSLSTIVPLGYKLQYREELERDQFRIVTISAGSAKKVYYDLALLASDAEGIRALIGDTLTTYTALKDWELSVSAGRDPPNEPVRRVARKTLEDLEKDADLIRSLSPEGIRRLIEILIPYVRNMVLIGSGRPASGSEHVLATYVEKILHQYHLDEGLRILHGNLVFVFALLMAHLQGQDVSFLKRMGEQYHLPLTPEAIGLHREIVVAALAEAGPRPDRFTWFDLHRVKPEEARGAVEAIFGKVPEIDFVAGSAEERVTTPVTIPYKEAKVPDPFTQMLADSVTDTVLPDIEPNSWVLEMGTGSGAVAATIAAYSQKHSRNLKIIVTDITLEAVKTAWGNVVFRYKLPDRATSIQSNLFEKLSSSSEDPVLSKFQQEKATFKLILFNPPIMPATKEILQRKLGPQEFANYDYLLEEGKDFTDGLGILRKFLSEVNDFLDPQGQMVVVLPAYIGKEKIQSAFTRAGFEASIIGSKLAKVRREGVTWNHLELIEKVSGYQFFDESGHTFSNVRVAKASGKEVYYELLVLSGQLQNKSQARAEVRVQKNLEDLLESRLKDIASELRWLKPYDVDFEDPSVYFGVHLGASVKGSSSPPTLTFAFNRITSVAAALRRKGIQLVHLPLEVPAEAPRGSTDPLEDFAQVLGALKSHPKVLYLTATQPHKTHLGKAVTRWDDRTYPLESANDVLLLRGDKEKIHEILGFNSDGLGWVEQYQQVWGRRGDRLGELRGKRVVILGGWGGFGQALTVQLLKEGVGHLTISTRRVNEVKRELKHHVKHLRRAGIQVPFYEVVSSYKEGNPKENGPRLLKAIRTAQIVVNATGVGQSSSESPLKNHRAIQPGAEAFDAVYRTKKGSPRRVTPFLRQARSQGARVFNGLGLYTRAMAIELGWLVKELTGEEINPDTLYEEVYRFAREQRRLKEAVSRAETRAESDSKGRGPEEAKEKIGRAVEILRTEGLDTLAYSSAFSSARDALRDMVPEKPELFSREIVSSLVGFLKMEGLPLWTIHQDAAKALGVIAEQRPELLTAEAVLGLEAVLRMEKHAELAYISDNETLGTIAEKRPELLTSGTVSTLEGFLKKEGLSSSTYASGSSALGEIILRRPELLTSETVLILEAVLRKEPTWTYIGADDYFYDFDAYHPTNIALLIIALSGKAPFANQALESLRRLLETKELHYQAKESVSESLSAIQIAQSGSDPVGFARLFLNTSDLPPLTVGSQELVASLLLKRYEEGGDPGRLAEWVRGSLIPSVSILEHLTGRSHDLLHTGAETHDKLGRVDPVQSEEARTQAKRANRTNLIRYLSFKTITEIKRSGKSEENFELNPYPSTYFVFSLLLKQWEEMGILDPIQAYHLSIDTQLGNEGLRLFIPSFFVGYPEELSVRLPLLTGELRGMGFPGLSNLDEGYTVDPKTGLMKGTQINLYQRPLGLKEETTGEFFRLYPQDIERTFFLVQGAALHSGKHGLEDKKLEAKIKARYGRFIQELNDFYISTLNLTEEERRFVTGEDYTGERHPYPDSAIHERIKKLRDKGITENLDTINHIFSSYVSDIKSLLYPEGTLKREIIESLEEGRLQLDEIYPRLEALTNQGNQEAQEILQKANLPRAEVRVTPQPQSISQQARQFLTPEKRSLLRLRDYLLPLEWLKYGKAFLVAVLFTLGLAQAASVAEAASIPVQPSALSQKEVASPGMSALVPFITQSQTQPTHLFDHRKFDPRSVPKPEDFDLLILYALHHPRDFKYTVFFEGTDRNIQTFINNLQKYSKTRYGRSPTNFEVAAVISAEGLISLLHEKHRKEDIPTGFLTHDSNIIGKAGRQGLLRVLTSSDLNQRTAQTLLIAQKLGVLPFEFFSRVNRPEDLDLDRQLDLLITAVRARQAFLAAA